jgi:hypothetical protein
MVGVKGKSGRKKGFVVLEQTKIKMSEAKLGRKYSDEHKRKICQSCKNAVVIHHINGNHFDDRPENRIVVTPSEHAIMHMLQGDIHIFKKGNKYSTKSGRYKNKNGNE